MSRTNNRTKHKHTKKKTKKTNRKKNKKKNKNIKRTPTKKNKKTDRTKIIKCPQTTNDTGKKKITIICIYPVTKKQSPTKAKQRTRPKLKRTLLSTLLPINAIRVRHQHTQFRQSFALSIHRKKYTHDSTNHMNPEMNAKENRKKEQEVSQKTQTKTTNQPPRDSKPRLHTDT